MYAVKSNRQYTISEKEIEKYQDDGYDIVDDDGTTVLKAGKGKTVPYAKYQDALNQASNLQAQVTDLQAQLDAAGGKKKE